MFKTTVLVKSNITYAVKFLILLTLATGAPLIGVHSQWITGPVVNMALILAVFLVGIRGALLIGILPSTIALGTGLLPAVLAPMIPFIIISNTILILLVDKACPERPRPGGGAEGSREIFLFQWNYWVALFCAAGAKYLFLFITSGMVINLLLKQELAVKVAQMMSWPQFFTAFIGGALAWVFLRFLKNNSKI